MLECSGKSTSRVKRNPGKILSGKILVTRQIFIHFSPIFFFPGKVYDEKYIAKSIGLRIIKASSNFSYPTEIVKSVLI